VNGNKGVLKSCYYLVIDEFNSHDQERKAVIHDKLSSRRHINHSAIET